MKRVQDILMEILMCDDGSSFPASTALRDIDGWDSLKHVMLVLELEKCFTVKLSADDIESMVTVADIERVLKEKGIDG
jgi:acyl carrier protein